MTGRATVAVDRYEPDRPSVALMLSYARTAAAQVDPGEIDSVEPST